MDIAVLKEGADGENRVAATPEMVKKYGVLGITKITVEQGAGAAAGWSDADYRQAGAAVADRAEVLKNAKLVLAVQGPEPKTLQPMAKGARLVALLSPFSERERVAGYAKLGIEALAMELMPRITRAQSMDILSSQANLSGYKAVLVAANSYGRVFPMMMTAAGTVTAARVFVMGVGVAGLQAIATARRLGAQVSATDVRSATKEQIISLGAKPIFVESMAGIEGEGAGGYAQEMSAEYKKAQAELVSTHIKKQDIIITTAQIPGRPAPLLISEAQLETMRVGSVIIDLAAESGGNVAGSVAGATQHIHGVQVIGARNILGGLAGDASALLARNLYNFIAAFWDAEQGTVILDAEIGDAIRLTRGGEIVHEKLLG